MVSRKQIEYVIFDMDGLMIDSEGVYTQVTNAILAPFGKVMTWEMKAGCMGRPELEAAKHLLSYFPDIDLPIETYLTKRNIAQDLAWPKVQLLPGVKKFVQHLKKHNIPMAVATGSRRAKYELKTGHHQDVFGAFGEKVVCGDDASVKKGKPEPDIFLVAARQFLGLGVGEGIVEECSEEEKVVRGKGLVFEDAIPGVQAGKRAGMSVVWVADEGLLNVEIPGPERADLILKSMVDFVPEEWGLPPYDSDS